MAEPQYVINFWNISTQVITTLIGFTIISWIFWYENIGKNLKYDLGKKLKGFMLIYYYNKFEKKFFKKFIKGRIPFSKFTYGDILRITKIGFLYLVIKNKTKDFKFQYEFKKINYQIFFSFYLFSILVIIGIIFIFQNIYLLRIIINYSEEQLLQDPTLTGLIDRTFNDFSVFIVIFCLYIFMLVFYAMREYKKNHAR